ncbi:MAG: hypothetical protein H6546_06990 [Chitinophagales bacterium]|nr:hypothetical protein [Chitinophagales bacterium]
MSDGMVVTGVDYDADPVGVQPQIYWDENDIADIPPGETVYVSYDVDYRTCNAVFDTVNTAYFGSDNTEEINDPEEITVGIRPIGPTISK